MNWLRNASLIALFLLLSPIAVLLYFGLGPLRTPVGYSLEVFRSMALSLVSSALAVVVDIIVFTPLAYYLARARNGIAESLVDLPVSVPHPIIGIALVLLGSPITPIGKFLLSNGINFFDSILGLVAALVIMSAPIYAKSMQPYFESKDTAAEDFAMGMGASRIRTLFSVVLPDSLQGVLSASLVAMSRALSEFGSISIIAYYVLQYPFSGVSPASVLVVQYYSSYPGFGAAVTASATMILISLPIAMAAHFIRRR